MRSRPVGPLAPNTAIFISLFLSMRPGHVPAGLYIDKDAGSTKSVTTAMDDTAERVTGGRRSRAESTIDGRLRSDTGLVIAGQVSEAEAQDCQSGLEAICGCAPTKAGRAAGSLYSR